MASPSSEPVAQSGRDRLGWICFSLHFAVLIYVVMGWLLPDRLALQFYLFFLPAVALQWWFNRNSCLLNNLESFIRSGLWRSADNPEEGNWLGMLAQRALGLTPTSRQIELFTYSVMALFWGLAYWHVKLVTS